MAPGRAERARGTQRRAPAILRAQRAGDGDTLAALRGGEDSTGAVGGAQRPGPHHRRPRLRTASSASIGVASYPSDATSMDELTAAADTAMYTAKTGGRDCVRHAENSINPTR